MRYLSIAAVLCLVATGLLLAENKRTVKVPKAAKDYTAKKDLKNGIELGLEMKRKQVAGDPIMLKVSVTNKGKRVVQHGPTDASYRDVRIKIVHSSGKDIPFTRFGKQRCGKRKPTDFWKFNPKPIKPGGTYSVTFNLSLLFDLTLPGTYHANVETEIYPLDSSKNSTEFTMKVSELEFKVSYPRPVIRARKPAKHTARGKTAPKK